MAVVYKYPFAIDDEIAIKMPFAATILLVEAQYGVPTIWALVQPEAAETIRRFRIVGTGHPFDETNLRHVASFQEEPFVWHMFEDVGKGHD